MIPDVELVAVRRAFPGKTAVDGVDLRVARGEFLTLLGPSGCGKTTILRLIAGFETPDDGTISIGGEDVTTLPPYRRNVNTVFQHYSLFPHLDVFENVAFGLEIRKLPRAELTRKVGDALALVRLSGYEKRSPRLLSGGEMQRVALARALVLEPRVLLLDEPLSALDLKLRKEMQVDLKALQTELGITFIFVTHDQEEALVLSDRIGVMREGRIEQLGPAPSIYEHPETAFVADFMGVKNFFRGRVTAVENREALFTTEGGLTLRLAAETASVGESLLVAVRSERIAFGRTIVDDASLQRARGTIVDALYLGSVRQFRVRLNDVESVVVDAPNRSEDSDGWKRGEEVELTWLKASCLTLREPVPE